jgi:hypothetical protein
LGIHGGRTTPPSILSETPTTTTAIFIFTLALVLLRFLIFVLDDDDVSDGGFHIIFKSANVADGIAFSIYGVSNLEERKQWSQASSYFEEQIIMLAWLLQAGPKAAKHRGKSHPLVTFCLHYAIVALITVSAHDWITATTQPESSVSTTCSPPLHRQSVGFFLGIYYVLYFSCRLALHWHQQDFYIEFYKQTFLCSVTIFHTALGLYTNRPILAESFCVAVGIDQISWYVDLAGKLILYVGTIDRPCCLFCTTVLEFFLAILTYSSIALLHMRL